VSGTLPVQSRRIANLFFLLVPIPSVDTAHKLAQAKRIRQAVSRSTDSQVSFTTLIDCILLLSQFPPSRPFVTICLSTTREICPDGESCSNVHFVRALRSHTEPALGDCSYLNTCHRMDSCRYVHWVLEDPGKLTLEELKKRKEAERLDNAKKGTTKEVSCQTFTLWNEISKFPIFSCRLFHRNGSTQISESSTSRSLASTMSLLLILLGRFIRKCVSSSSSSSFEYRTHAFDRR